MDYLLDAYLYPYLPVELDAETKKDINQRAVRLVQIADWFCKYQSPLNIWKNHPSFLAGEILFFILCALTFCHAWRHGGRYLYVWIGIAIHALNVENLCYWIPDMDNFWQAQGILTFFGARAPLYILLGIYHMFDYTAYVMIQRLRLPWWAEGPAVGLCAVMLDFPFYWVPWNSFYFHASFACSFVWILNLSRKYIVEEVHSEITSILFLSLYAVIVWSADRQSGKPGPARAGNRWWFDELSCAVALEYLFFMILVVIGQPSQIVAEGLHQAVGPCNYTQKVQTPTGLVLQKKMFLCADNYDEGYFDFKCLPGGKLRMPEDGSPLDWYAICGTEYENRAEYIVIVWGACILFGYIFYNLAAWSGETPVIPAKVYRAKAASPAKPARNPLFPAEPEKIHESPKSPKSTPKKRAGKSPARKSTAATPTSISSPKQLRSRNKKTD
ncbi:hypothetical protein PRIPAC_75828 [Pristionchus pacificus]|nr:hypothetical protein PRIPAC_75828 [Pristionchus pacificus]|eukprot:PDM64361.1 hypothetical protein PRIPAC_52617 [Pristionchus pacificus]